MCQGKFHIKCCDLTGKDSSTCDLCLPIRCTSTITSPTRGNSPYILEDLQNFICKRGLNICHQNICGLIGKIDSVRVLLDMHQGIHIIGMGETHLSNNIHDSEIQIDGYKTFRRDRSGNDYGGGLWFICGTRLMLLDAQT